MIEYPNKYERNEKSDRQRPRRNLVPNNDKKSHSKGVFLTGIQLLICVVVILSAVLIKQFGGEFYTNIQPTVVSAINKSLDSEDVTQVFKNIGDQLPDAAEIFKNDSTVSSSENISSGDSTSATSSQITSSDTTSQSSETTSDINAQTSSSSTYIEMPQADSQASAVAASQNNKTSLEMKYLSLSGSFEKPTISKVSSDKSDFKSDSKISFSPIKLSQLPIKPVIGEITSAYGYRSNPVTGVYSFHSGLDIEADEGEPIRASFGGKVETVADNATYGHYIILDHSNGIKTMYAHCSEVVSKEGEVVKAGDTIAKVGSSGLTTGSHLHFELRINDVSYNPQWVV